MNNLELFISYLTFEKRYSAHTCSAYKHDLEQYSAFILKEFEEADLINVNHRIIRQWLSSLMENEMDARSVNRKISCLKSFYKYMIRLGKMQTNPMVKIVSPKTAKKLPVYIQAEKMDNLLDRVAWKDDFEGIRNHLIIELFYTSGMRLAELMSLTAASINFNQKQLKVLGKRNKERIIPILPEMAEHIKKYTQLRNALNPDTDFLFVMENGKALYRSAIYRLVNKELGQVTSQEKRSPHVLRHSFATEMLNNGADLNAIKEILGHANLQATQVYTHNTIEKLKKAYTKAHPRA